MFGFTNPFPQKYGKEASSTLENILDALLSAQGTALSKEREEYNWVFLHAVSRFLNEMAANNNILANITDPYKTPSSFIPRLEKIYGLYSNPGESDKFRRARIATHIFFYGKMPNFATINDFLTISLGEIYVGIINSMATDATLYVPGGGSVPGGGPVFLDGDLLPLSPWTGTTCYLAIQLQQPIGMSDEEFYTKAGEIQLLDPLLPIWMTFDWFKEGGSGSGFFLDEDKNLDNQSFSP